MSDSNRHTEEVSLQEQQVQLLKRCLAENNIQLPPEFATIEQQLNDLRRPRSGDELEQSDVNREQDASAGAKPSQIASVPEEEGNETLVTINDDDTPVRRILAGKPATEHMTPTPSRHPLPEEEGNDTLVTINDDDTPVRRILAGKPATENMTPTPSRRPLPSSRRGNTGLNLMEKAWKDRAEAVKFNKNAGYPARAPYPSHHNTQQPGAFASSSAPQPGPSSPAQPSPSRPDGDDETEEMGEHSFYDRFDYPNPDEEQFGPPPEGATQLSSDGEDEAHARASNSPGKRTRGSDDDEDSEDEAPLPKKRKTAGKAPASASSLSSSSASSASPAAAPAPVSATAKGKAPASAPASASRKRARDDGDDASERPAKRQRRTANRGNTPVAAAQGEATPAPATSSSGKRSREGDDDGDSSAPEQSSKRQKTSASLARAQEQPEDRWADLPPSPAVEPLTPERASPEPAGPFIRQETPEPDEPVVAGPAHQQAADDEPPREPATRGLGHTEQGAITVTQLQKMAKYRTTTNSNGAIPNRPWVFAYSFGEQYALYVMRCPTKGCPRANYNVGPDAFRFHPIRKVSGALHLRECCGGDYVDGDWNAMVRKYCKQVISDKKKAVTIEWARRWNDDLIEEYGGDANLNLRGDNVFY